MVSSSRFRRHFIKDKNFKSYKGQKIIDCYVRQRPERIKQAEEYMIIKYLMLYFSMTTRGFSVFYYQNVGHYWIFTVHK